MAAAEAVRLLAGRRNPGRVRVPVPRVAGDRSARLGCVRVAAAAPPRPEAGRRPAFRARPLFRRGRCWNPAQAVSRSCYARDRCSAMTSRSRSFWGSQADSPRRPRADSHGGCSGRWQEGSPPCRCQRGRRGRWAKRKQADHGARVGEVRVECAERRNFRISEFPGPGQIATSAS